MTMTAEKPRIGNRVRELRELAGMTQQQLAAAAELSMAAVYQIEQGRSNDPVLSTLLKLARAFGVSLNDLTAGLDDVPAPEPRKARKPRTKKE